MKRPRLRPSLNFCLALVIAGFSLGLALTFPRGNPATTLPVPKIAQVYLPGPLVIPPPSAPVLGAQTQIDPKDLIAAINQERTKRNIPALRISPLLMKAAQMRADVILKYQNFSHQDPHEGIELTTVLPKVNYHFAYASENIGMGGVSGPSFATGFMNSPSHRENLLNQYLVDTGATIVTGPYKQYYVNIAVQLFAIPGGKDESLGYSTADAKRYRDELSYLDNQLNPLRWIVNGIVQNSFYSADRYVKLVRQRDIVASLYAKMEKEQPLTSDDTLLVQEFNKLSGELTQTPQG